MGRKGIKSRRDDLVHRIAGLVGGVQKIVPEAIWQYSTELEGILKENTRDRRRIEKCLDGMLDFCFDADMLALYKKLCRYYYDIDPAAAASYVYAYRDIWEDGDLRTRKVLEERKLRPLSAARKSSKKKKGNK